MTTRVSTLRLHSTYKGVKIYKNCFGFYECVAGISNDLEKIINSIDETTFRA